MGVPTASDTSLPPPPPLPASVPVDAAAPCSVAGHLSRASDHSRLLLLPTHLGTTCQRSAADSDVDALARVDAMVDSGASHCFISSATVSRTGLTSSPAQAMTVTLADGTSIVSSLSYSFCMHVSDAVSLSVDARIVDSLSHDLVLGIDWLH